MYVVLVTGAGVDEQSNRIFTPKKKTHITPDLTFYCAHPKDREGNVFSLYTAGTPSPSL